MAASAYMLRATTVPFFSIPSQPSPLKRKAISLNPSLRLPPLKTIRLSNPNRLLLLLSDHYTVLNCSDSTSSPSNFPTICTTKPRKDPAGGVGSQEKGPNMQEMAMEALSTAMQAMQAPAVAAIVAVVLAMSNPLSSLAATGGRMTAVPLAAFAPRLLILIPLRHLTALLLLPAPLTALHLLPMTPLRRPTRLPPIILVLAQHLLTTNQSFF